MATYEGADPGTHPTTNAPGQGGIFGPPQQNMTMIVGLVLAILVTLFVVLSLL
jgi:hypothetical protein